MYKSILKYLLPGLILLLIDSIFIARYYPCHQTQESIEIASRLDAIEMQLQSLQQELRKPNPSVDINKLTSSIEQIKNKDESTLNSLFSENRTQLLQKLDALHEIVSTINNNNDKGKETSTHVSGN